MFALRLRIIFNTAMKKICSIFILSFCFLSSYSYQGGLFKKPIHADSTLFNSTRKQNAFGISVGLTMPTTNYLGTDKGTLYQNTANNGFNTNLCFEGTMSKVLGFIGMFQYTQQPFIHHWNEFTQEDAMKTIGLYFGSGFWIGSHRIMIQLNALGGINLQKNLEVQVAPDSLYHVSFFEAPKLGYRFDASVRYKLTKGIGVKFGTAYQFYHPDAKTDKHYNPLNVSNQHIYFSLLGLIN